MSTDRDDLAPAAVIDVSFDVEGRLLPREHRRALASALQRALPWLSGTPGVAVHRLNLPPGTGREVVLSRRTRLTLRVPRERAADAEALDGSALEVAGEPLLLRRPRRRELLAFGTLYAHFVAFDGDDEAAFLKQVESELAAIAVKGRAICGRHQRIEGGSLGGFSLMIDGLAPADALRVQECGLGRHRDLGCGVFVPHKSAAAVGTPL